MFTIPDMHVFQNKCLLIFDTCMNVRPILTLFASPPVPKKGYVGSAVYLAWRKIEN